MIFEILTTTIIGAVSLKAFIEKKGLSTNDSGKIQRIMSLTGLNVKDGKDTLSTQLIKKKQYDWGWEYKYRIPLGRSFADYQNKLNVLQDGLNNRRKNIDIHDLKKLDLGSDIFQQLKSVWNNKLTEQKEIELDFDGLLIIRVYDQQMKQTYEWDDSLLQLNSWKVPIGFTRNEVIYHDFDIAKHLIIAGATGYGKSAILKLITSTLIEQKPDHLELSLIDLKGGAAFHRFRNCKQVKYYSRDPESAYELLQKVQNEMQVTFNKVVDDGFEDVKEAKIKQRHFVIIDEAADISDDREAMTIITDIARRGRSAGYYLVFCTQYPTAQIIPSQTKRNIIARLCYVVDTDTASRVVLDEGGAEKLPDIPGRGIYKNSVKRHILQSPYISNETIQQRISQYVVKKEGDTIEKEIDKPSRKNIVTIEEI